MELETHSATQTTLNNKAKLQFKNNAKYQKVPIERPKAA